MARQRKLTTKANLTWQDAFADFLTFKAAQGISKRTTNDYQIHVQRFFKHYPDSWPDDLRDACLDWLAQPSSPAYYNLKRQNLKTFFAFCVAQGVLNKNPLDGIKKRRDEGKARNIDQETLQQLLKLPDKESFAGLRDYALLLFTLDTGARPSEALSLMPEDFDVNALAATIDKTRAKTRRGRTLPISPPTAKTIKRLIAARHPEWDADAPVFCGYEGKPLNIRSWEKRLNEYSSQLGVTVTPYQLRHSFALLYLKNGGNAFALSNTLGHTDLSMTKRYIALTNQDLAEIHKTASPLHFLLKEGKRIKKLKP